MRDIWDAVTSGEADFSCFVRETMRDWERLAESLFARWAMPAGVEAIDIRQEMLTAAWKSAKKYAPDRGVTARRFLVWSAMAHAKRGMRMQRQAPKSNPAEARFPLIASMPTEDVCARYDDPIESVAEIREAWRRARARAKHPEVLDAIAASESLEHAAERVRVRSCSQRSGEQVSLQTAHRMVRRAAKDVLRLVA